MSLELFVSLILATGVLIINGWTDAPTSIATAVSTGAIKARRASILCGTFNFLGVILACLINSSVAKRVYSFGDFGSKYLLGISATMATVIIFGILCWMFSLPSSESHAMLVSMLGASYGIQGRLRGITSIISVLVFMVISCALAFLSGFSVKKCLKRSLPYKKLQILSFSLDSLMHGWQSGLKFIAIFAFLLGIGLDSGKIPPFLAVLVAVILGLSSSLSGKRIATEIGKNIVNLRHSSAFSSDIATYLTLSVCSLLGMPVSTGNVKCLAIMGAGYGDGERINKKTATKLFISFIAVFPICFIVSYIITRLFL